MDLFLEAAPCGFVSINNQGVITSANQMFVNLMACPRDALINHHIETVLSPANKFFFHSYIYPAIQLNGSVREVYLSIRASSGKIIHVIFNACKTDTTEDTILCILMPIEKRIEYEKEIRSINKKIEVAYREKKEAVDQLENLMKENQEKQEQLIQLNARLDKLASTDDLTGLNNRRTFLECLTQEIDAFRHSTTPFSLLILDIDHFKCVNDTWGHLVGDQILIKLAHIMIATTPEMAKVSRYGGEEFVIILQDTDVEKSKQFAEDLRTTIESSDWGEFAITVSIGVATMNPMDSHHSLLAKADYALYASKNAGRNRVTHADSLDNRPFEKHVIT